MKQESQIFHVQPDQANQAICRALRQWLPGKSWSEVQRLLRSRHVLVSGNLCVDEGRRLKPAEVVKVLAQPAAVPPKDDDVRIQYIDPHLVVVEKPSGMTTLRHREERNWPGKRKQLQPTLDEVLPRIIEKKEQRGPKRKGLPKRVRAVHRLDRETSGLMVFARTVDAERGLGLQFRDHSLHRKYIAVVPGRVEAQTFTSYLIPDRGDGRRGSGRDTKQGKKAVTHVTPVEFIGDNGDYTVLECRLETGRTHQIRIHLSEAGHPLCGDKLYRGRYPGPIMPDESRAPRVALHAEELGFDHPITNEKVLLKMPLPDDLAAFLERLRRGPRKAGGSREEISPAQ